MIALSSKASAPRTPTSRAFASFFVRPYIYRAPAMGNVVYTAPIREKFLLKEI